MSEKHIPKPSDSRREARGQPPREQRQKRDRPSPAEVGQTSAIHQTPDPRVGERAKKVSKTPPE